MRATFPMFLVSRILAALFLILTFGVHPAVVAQNVIVHRSIRFEDGDPKKDGDGDTNKIVVWKGGATHVCVSKMFVDSGYTLVIQPGAIVKFADAFDTDTNGNLKSWKPPTDAGLVSSSKSLLGVGGVIKISGATLTDIRDDAVGGDDNQDGGATTPKNTSPNIRFSGSAKDVLENSTLRYVYEIGHLGSMRITGNHFENFGIIDHGSGYPQSMDPVMPDASPIISNNTFEFIPSGGFLDLRGCSATIIGNRFTRASGGGPAVYIGLKHALSAWADRGALYPTGQTVVENNVFETSEGIEVSAFDSDSLFMKASFRGTISGNRFHCAAGNGFTAMSLMFDANLQVTGNIVENYVAPVVISLDRGPIGGQTPGLHVNNNRFELVSSVNVTAVVDTFWHRGVYVDMKNNYWGDPSGPLDASKADNFYNPRGKGFRVSDGIEYVPFIGGTTSASKDAISISATVLPDTLVPKNSAFISVKVNTLAFSSTPHGKIIVTVRDGEGFILNTPTTTVSIVALQTSADIPQISVSVPANTHAITVEADIVPDDEIEPARSNVVTFPVPQPVDAFTITGVYDDATGLPLLPILIPGSLIAARVEFTYTHSASFVDFDVTLNDVDPSGFEIDQRDANRTTFTVPAGVDAKGFHVLYYTVPLRDVTKYPVRKLWGKFLATDAGGKVIGHLSDVLPIFVETNSVRFGKVDLWTFDHGPNRRGRTFFLEGDSLGISVEARWSIGTPNISDWQLVVGPYRALGDGNTVLHEFTPSGPVKTNIKTGSHPNLYSTLVRNDPAWPVVPVGAHAMRIYIHIETPNGVIVAIDSMDIPVRPQPVRTVDQALGTGASSVSFAPLPVTLNVTSNQAAGGASAMQFNGQFHRAFPSGLPSIASADPWHWQFVPLERWWGVFDTLPEGSVTAKLTIAYDPATDFPPPGIVEDSLVVCGYNRYSRALEALPTTIDKSAHTTTVSYSKFFDTYVIAGRTTVTDQVTSRTMAVQPTLAITDAYPNPVRESALFTLTVTRSMPVTVSLFNMMGQNISTLLRERVEPGVHALHWNIGNLPSGVYHVHVVGASEAMDRPMMLVR